MEFTKKEAFAIQIGHYLKNGQFKEAKELADKMIKKFPKEPLSHFMAAKSYYFSEEYEKAKTEGRKAFNLSHTKQDMMNSAIVTASSLFMLGRYNEAHGILRPFEKEDNEEIKKMLVIFFAVKGRGDEAAKYYRELHDVNREAAAKFIRKLAERSQA